MAAQARSSRLILWANLAVLIALAYQTFGFIYEAVVFSPNWVVDTPAQLTRVNEFWVNTWPGDFYMPSAVVSVIAIVVLLVKDWRTYRWCGLAVLGTVLITMPFALVILPAMFGPDRVPSPFLSAADPSLEMAWTWNILNGVRLLINGAATVLAFRLYVQQLLTAASPAAAEQHRSP